MSKIRSYINKLSKSQKVICLILILGFILLLSIGIPTLARFKNRNIIVTTTVWDGTTASSYKDGDGTENDPYIISNGSELAYFYTQLSTNDYNNTYFALSNDIVLNDGIFNYDATNGIQYIKNGQTYYVDDYTNKYYDNVNREGTEIGTINTFNPLNGFKGHFDGKSFRIYGLYITNETNEELALFTNLQGSLHDLYVENAMVYGGTVTSGIASTTSNATLSNILNDGYVIGKSTLSTKNISTVPTASLINVQNTETTSYINSSNNIPFVGSEITSTSLTGNYVINGSTESETTIKINGVTVSGGSFNINLGNTILNSIPVITSTTTEGTVTLTLSNLSYNIVYKYATSGGIIGKSSNTTIENTINKAYVYGYSTSGGLVGVTTDSLSINQSYNTGNIDSEYVSGGLVGIIEKSSNNIAISKSYNSGDMTATDIGGLIGIISNNTGSITINNIFNASTTNYSIGTVSNTTVNVTNAYYVNGSTAVKNGTINGSFVSTTISNLQTKSYVTTNLSFNEFVDFNDLGTNSGNAWVYDYQSLPILFVDDISNPIADIHVSTYTWNNLSYELSPTKLNSNITFSIEAADELRPLKEIYYYISNSSTALTQTQIAAISTWNAYSDIVQISTEGFYVVYVKVVDYDDNVTYFNTDLLVLDKSATSVNVSVDDNTWSNLRATIDHIYIDRPKTITVQATDDLSGILSIKYYLTDQILDTNALNAISANSWTTYTDGISLNEIGTDIVYVQVKDNCNHTTYVNTDYITYDGYSEGSFIIGRNASSYLNADPYITNKGTVTQNISYTSTSNELSNHTHNLISNILLPIGTKITLVDKITDKVYEYKIATSEDIFDYNNSCDPEDLDCIKVATYPLTLFQEIGTGSTSKPYIESTYYSNGVISEDFSIILDLSKANTTTNYNNVTLSMTLKDSNGVNVRPTLYSTLKNFNIYSTVSSEDAKANLYLTTNYSGNAIAYNSESNTTININSGLSYKYVNDFKIVDTTYENKIMGLSIKMVDSNGVTVDKDYLKNIIIKIGDDEYYPEDDNIVRINLNNGMVDTTKTITIVTHNSNSSLDAGTYYFKISNYASYDGRYEDTLGNIELSIPVTVTDNTANTKYSFDVIMDDANRIISKVNNQANVSFNILQNGNLRHPDIRVSLYKKDQLTAFNQSYSIVDLADYVSNGLNSCADNVYYVTTSPVQYNKYTKLYNHFELNFITANFENTGYKMVFDLYDGTKKIGTIEKHFVVK